MPLDVVCRVKPFGSRDLPFDFPRRVTSPSIFGSPTGNFTKLQWLDGGSRSSSRTNPPLGRIVSGLPRCTKNFDLVSAFTEDPGLGLAPKISSRKSFRLCRRELV
jgi:hypothetical protein